MFFIVKVYYFSYAFVFAVSIFSITLDGSSNANIFTFELSIKYLKEIEQLKIRIKMK